MVVTFKNNQSAKIESPIHFVGIGGSGMSALAELALRRGYSVQGSDSMASVVTGRLNSMGIAIQFSHSNESVKSALTVVRSSAIQDSNPEIVEARRLGLPILHRSEMLAYLMQGRQAITVAGTHGKSTTSAIIVHMLERLGLDPEAALGGAMRQYQSAARAGNGKFFVAEADESDGSFIRYNPYCAVITNTDLDHMEFFKSPEGLAKAFSQHLRKVDPDGFAVIGWDSPMLRDISSNINVRRIAFGFLLGCDVRAREYENKQGETVFTALVERDRVKCRLPMIGRHNVQNALAALAVARGLEMNIQDAAAALESFPGVERRMNLVHKSPTLAIFDDYAHNPGKIAACIQALRDSFQDRQLQVIFQPHRYSRLETMYDDMLGAVSGADIVHMLPVYSAGETTVQDFSPIRLASDLTRLFGVRSVACDDFNAAIDSVLATLRLPAVVLTVGAGDICKAAQLLRDRLE